MQVLKDPLQRIGFDIEEQHYRLIIAVDNIEAVVRAFGGSFR